MKNTTIAVLVGTLFFLCYFGFCFAIGSPAGLYLWKTDKAVASILDGPITEKSVEEKFDQLAREAGAGAKYSESVMNVLAGEKK